MPKYKIIVNPITSDLKPDDKTMVLQEMNVIQDFNSQDTSEVKISMSTSQKIDQAKGIIEGIVNQDTRKWESEVKDAAKQGNLRNEDDRANFDGLKAEEKSYEKLYEQNVEALNIIHKQNLQLMNAEQAWSSVMWNNDKKFQEMPKRDFLKEAQGDPHLASLYATQAASAQYKLLDDIKNNIRKVQEQKIQYLNVRPKPNLEEELKKVNFDLYKKN